MDPIQTVLPYRPRPRSEEDIQGFTLRLASWYGYKNHTTFAKNVFEWTLPKYLDAESTSGQRWLEHLEAALRIGPHELSPGWASSAATQFTLGSSRLIQDVRVRSPRLCEHCVAQHGRFNKEWQIAHHLACPVHYSPLLNCCPSCQSPFVWERSLFKGCKKCGHEWQAKEINSTAAYELLANLQSSICPESVYRAYLHAINPEGHSIWLQKNIKFDPRTHHDVMLTAYALASSPEFSEKFLTDFSVDSNSSQTAVGEQLDRLRKTRIRNLLNEDAAGIESSIFPRTDFMRPDPEKLWAMVLPKYRRYRDNRTINDLADSTTASEVLGITVHDLNRLVDTGIIDCLGNSTVLRDRVYSLAALNAQVEQFFKKAEKPKAPSTGLSLNSTQKVLKRFGFSMIDAVIWAFEAKLPFWIAPSVKNDGALKCVYLERTSLVRRCEEEFHNRSDDEVLTRQQVRDITCLSDDALHQVSQMGLLPSKRWSGHGAQFEIRTIKSFLSRFRSTRREAAILGVQSKVVKSIHPDLLDDHQIVHLSKVLHSRPSHSSSSLRSNA